MSTSFELENDIAYLKAVIYNYKKNKTSNKAKNVDYQERLNFVVVQLKDIFRN